MLVSLSIFWRTKNETSKECHLQHLHSVFKRNAGSCCSPGTMEGDLTPGSLNKAKGEAVKKQTTTNSSKIQNQRETNKNQRTHFLFCLFFLSSGFNRGLKKAWCLALMAEGRLGAEVAPLQGGQDIACCSWQQPRRGNGEHQGAGRYLGDMLLLLFISWSDLLFLAFFFFIFFLF